jgi:predicted O-linked N-acetylglucosamine transferase (SPINDLY family)
LLAALGALEEGLAVLRQAVDLSPSSAGLHSNLIFLLEFADHADEAANQAERKHWYELHGRQHAARIAPHDNDRDRDRKLRIGYVSADFINHTAARVLAGVLLNHDPAQIETVCYANIRAEDKMTAKFRAAAQLWRRIDRLDDAAVADLVREDAIDILVDLSGHSAGNRLAVFARKPAPIQITAWGLPRGTGVATIDYIFSDPVLIPRENATALSEKVIYLPCWMPFIPLDDESPVTDLPAERGDGVTFGCFNRLEKASDAALQAWGRILQAVPGSRLLLVDDYCLAGTNAVFAARLRNSGIPLDRLEIRPRWQERRHYLDGFGEIDLALDPFPQSGGVTTFESLWMGVPVIALLGSSASGRGSAAILSGLGLDDCVARTVDEYVDRAVAKATDLRALAQQRGDLRARLLRGPPGDVVAYTRAVEAAYRSAWRRWCAEPR